MQIAVIDFETYYDKAYSLSKLSTEDYVNSPQFEVILCAVKIGREPTQWRTGTLPQLAQWFDDIRLWDHCVGAHNMMFDGLILQRHFGRLPKKIFCTLFMAQALLKPTQRSLSLKNCLTAVDSAYAKGTTVDDMIGRTRRSLTAHELNAYAAYCVNDVEGTMDLVRKLGRQLPPDEFDVMDLTLRMYLEPQLQVDANRMAQTLHTTRVTKQKLIDACRLPADVLRSNHQFAQALTSAGVDVPLKISPTTQKLIPALAITDPGWKDLEDAYGDDPDIGPMLAARVGARSTIAETRCERLLDIGVRYQHLRVPLMYHAAHTGRYGGTQGINLQNLPGVRRSDMRYAITAPPGYVVLSSDLKQIEARLLALLAGQRDLLQAFAEGRDVYSEFASRLYGQPVVDDGTPLNTRRRHVGKTCILGLGYGMGAPRFADTLRKDNIKLDPTEALRTVGLYRGTYINIPRLWYFGSDVIRQALGQPETRLVSMKFPNVDIMATARQILLPNGMRLRYPAAVSGDANTTMYSFAGEQRYLNGPKLIENIVQALARGVIMHHMLRIARELGLYPALQQHDDLDYVVPEDEAPAIATAIQTIMRVPPSWVAQAPLDVSIKYGRSLGDCK